MSGSVLGRGAKSLNEIKEVLSSMGLRLGMDSHESPSARQARINPASDQGRLPEVPMR